MAAAAAPAAAAAAPAAPASALARRQAGKMAEVFGFVVYDGYDGGFAAAHAAAADWAGAQWLKSKRIWRSRHILTPISQMKPIFHAAAT